MNHSLATVNRPWIIENRFANLYDNIFVYGHIPFHELKWLAREISLLVYFSFPGLPFKPKKNLLPIMEKSVLLPMPNWSSSMPLRKKSGACSIRQQATLLLL